jgi:hypothetical protein
MPVERLCACVMLLAVGPVAQLAPTPSSAKAQMLTRAQNQTMTGGNLLGDITMVLFEFQKIAGKEARDESKTASMTKELVDQQKAAKLQNDNKQIEKQMEEASEKAQNLFDAADTSFRTGIASGAAQVGSNHWEALVNHLRSVQANVRGLRQRTPVSGTRTVAGPDLKRALDRFALLQRRLAATSKLADDELKKLERR